MADLSKCPNCGMKENMYIDDDLKLICKTCGVDVNKDTPETLDKEDAIAIISAGYVPDNSVTMRACDYLLSLKYLGEGGE